MKALEEEEGDLLQRGTLEAKHSLSIMQCYHDFCTIISAIIKPDVVVIRVVEEVVIQVVEVVIQVVEDVVIRVVEVVIKVVEVEVDM